MSQQTLNAEELNLLGGLLAFPGRESLAVIGELANRYHWLKPAVHELTALPLDQWQGEYTRLFINGFPKTPCPPFESAYRSGEMGGPSVYQLEDLYARAGLQVDDTPADFLGTELEFAAYLIDSPETDKTVWKTLWHQHLTQWAGRFAQDLANEAQLRLYQLLSERLNCLFSDQGTRA